jgi:hypothetical protein
VTDENDQLLVADGVGPIVDAAKRSRVAVFVEDWNCTDRIESFFRRELAGAGRYIVSATVDFLAAVDGAERMSATRKLKQAAASLRGRGRDGRFSV